MDGHSYPSLQELGNSFLGYLPDLLTGLAILLVGLAIAWLLARFLVRVLVILRVDRVVGRLTGPRTFARGDVRHAFLSFVGAALGVLVFLVFLDRALQLWRLPLVADLLERFLRALPNLLVGAVILAAGWAIASTAARSLRSQLFRSGIKWAEGAARVVKVTLVAFACAVAMVQAKLAVQLVTLTFLLAFGAFLMIFVLAAGLGSRRAVEAFWEAVLTKRKERKEKGPEEDL